LYVLNITIWASLLQGTILAIARFNEPVYSFVLLQEVYSWFGLIYDDGIEDENDIKKNPAFTLMYKQLSIDLIYTILHAITEHTVGMTKKASWTDYKNYDFTNQNNFTIDSMVI
jgi:hypothetical protein